jgi:hypothetical protein
MKVRLPGNYELDVLSPDEARTVVGAELDKRARPKTELVRAEESGVTDAAGGLVLPVYVVPAGMEFRVHVVVVEVDGFTPAVPFNGAGAYWRLRVATRAVDEASLVAAAANGSQLPFVRSYGFMQGAVSVNQEALEFELVAGPAAKQVRVFAQGTLVPFPGSPLEQ